MEKKGLETSKVQFIKDSKLYPFNNYFPQNLSSVYFSENLKINYNVIVCKNFSVWYSTVIIVNVNYICKGKITNIQICSILTVTKEKISVNIMSM